jgi:hypothetical protein
MLAKLGLEVIPALVVAELLGELRVALGVALVLDALDGYIVADGLSCKTLLTEVRRVDDLELQLLAGL